MGPMCILSELNETVRNGFPFSVLTLLVGQQVLFTDWDLSGQLNVILGGQNFTEPVSATHLASFGTATSCVFTVSTKMYALSPLGFVFIRRMLRRYLHLSYGLWSNSTTVGGTAVIVKQGLVLFCYRFPTVSSLILNSVLSQIGPNQLCVSMADRKVIPDPANVWCS